LASTGREPIQVEEETMHRIRIRSAVIAAVAAVAIQLAAGSAGADPVTYNYVGNNFNFCGFGCPENLPSGVVVTPVGEGDEVTINDYIIASLTFAGALPHDPGDPDRIYSQSELPAITAWSMGDASGAIALSGTTFGPFPPVEDDGELIAFPPLMLTTDADGNIVNYLMGVHVAPHHIFISNPPLTFEETEDGVPFTFTVADFLVGYYAPDPGGSEDLEFDLLAATPGKWTRVTTDPDPDPTPVPEPGTLLMLGAGVVSLARLRQRV
jgi:hypothetical protein